VVENSTEEARHPVVEEVELTTEEEVFVLLDSLLVLFEFDEGESCSSCSGTS
jgi:hypothetical protein